MTFSPLSHSSTSSRVPLTVTQLLLATSLAIGAYPSLSFGEAPASPYTEEITPVDMVSPVTLELPEQEKRQQVSSPNTTTYQATPSKQPVSQLGVLTDHTKTSPQNPEGQTKTSHQPQPSSPSLESDPVMTSAQVGNGQEAPKKAKAVMVDIVSNTLDYDPDEKLYTATGDVKVIVSEQNTELLGDKVMYDPVRDLMVAEGNVVITNKGQKIYGTYAKIDLTRKSALINDPITVLKEVRVKAKESLVEDGFVRLINGKLVIPPQSRFLNAVARKANTPYNDLTDEDLSRLAVADPFESPDPEKPSNAQLNNHPDQPEYKNTLVPQELDMSWDRPNTEGVSSWFDFEAKEIDVVQGQDGYNDINLKWPKMKFRGMTVGRLPQMDFAHVEQYEDLEYLGPALGMDPDFGGLYAGPGFDFRLGDGFVNVSPIVSFGTGNRRSRRGQDIENVSGPGAGLILNYMSHFSKVQAGYNVAVGTPTLLAQRKFNEGRTKLMLGANEDYTNGFFGWERPQYIAQVKHVQHITDLANEKLRLTGFASAGVARDEFFPTNDEDFFVLPDNPDSTPVTAGRVQLQAQIQNKSPLLRWKLSDNSFASVGLLGQASLSGYSTGDFYGLFRGGPTLNFNLGNRFRSYNRYMHTLNTGDSPFVFDTYFRGRNSLMTRNQFRVNDFLTVGMRHRISLQQDNAQNALFTDNAFFVLFGPEDVKFNLAYDFIRRRSFFGISFLPGKSHRDIHYEKMNIHQPQDYEGRKMNNNDLTSEMPIVPTNTMAPAGMGGMDAFGNVQDIGLMNGGRAR